MTVLRQKLTPKCQLYREARPTLWAKHNAVMGEPAKKAKRKMSAQGLANIRAGVAKRLAAQGEAKRILPCTEANNVSCRQGKDSGINEGTLG
jgi:hypothetical protein